MRRGRRARKKNPGVVPGEIRGSDRPLTALQLSIPREEARSSVSHAFDSVPHVPDPELNTPVSTEEFALQQKPDRHQTHDIEPSTTEASLHG